MCGFSKNHRWNRETWWWDDKVDNAVKAKQFNFKTYNALVKAGNTTETTKAPYNEAERAAKRAEKGQFAYISPNDSSIFKLAKQMDRTNQDAVRE